MKKLALFGLILILLSSLALAYGTMGDHCGPSTPTPLKFILTVQGEVPISQDVIVTNIRTGEVLTKNEVPQLEMVNGMAGLDLLEFDSCDESIECQCYKAADPFFGYPGDLIEVRLCDFSPSCTYTFNLDFSNMDSGGRITVDITDPSVPIETIVERLVQVPSDCPPGEDCSQPDEPVNNTILVAIMTGLACLGIGAIGGYRFNTKKYYYKSKDGKIPKGTYIRHSQDKISHKHYGLRNYHDPLVQHMDKTERHPSGQCDPEYIKNEAGKYVYKS